MIRLIWRLVRFTLVLGVLGVGLYFFHGVILRPVGNALIAADRLDKADYLLLLAGAPYLTAAEGARLYHEGWAPAVLLTNQPRPAGQDSLLRLGVPVKDSQEAAREVLIALRVPAEAVHAVPGRSADVGDELGAVRQFLTGRTARTIILVTTKIHSARAKRLCTEVLGPAVSCTTRPAADDPFDPAHWWAERQSIEQVVGAYAGWIYDLSGALWRRAVSPGVIPPAVTIR